MSQMEELLPYIEALSGSYHEITSPVRSIYGLNAWRKRNGIPEVLPPKQEKSEAEEKEAEILIEELKKEEESTFDATSWEPIDWADA